MPNLYITTHVPDLPYAELSDLAPGQQPFMWIRLVQLDYEGTATQIAFREPNELRAWAEVLTTAAGQLAEAQAGPAGGAS